MITVEDEDQKILPISPKLQWLGFRIAGLLTVMLLGALWLLYCFANTQDAMRIYPPEPISNVLLWVITEEKENCFCIIYLSRQKKSQAKI